jgi:hypothetical protein
LKESEKNSAIPRHSSSEGRENTLQQPYVRYLISPVRRRFRLLFQFLDRSIAAIGADVESAAVIEFANACQFDDYDPSDCNIFEFEHLCETWEVDSFAGEIKTAKQSSPLDEIAFRQRHGKDTTAVEPEFAKFSLLSRRIQRFIYQHLKFFVELCRRRFVKIVNNM